MVKRASDSSLWCTDKSSGEIPRVSLHYRNKKGKRKEK